MIPHVGNRLGIVDRFIQTLRGRIRKYMTLYKTNKYIDVLPQLVENINNSMNTGIMSIPNKPNRLAIDASHHRNCMKL